MFFFDVENRCSRCDFLWIPESHDEILRIMYGKLVGYIDYDGNIEAFFFGTTSILRIVQHYRAQHGFDTLNNIMQDSICT